MWHRHRRRQAHQPRQAAGSSSSSRQLSKQRPLCRQPDRQRRRPVRKT